MKSLVQAPFNQSFVVDSLIGEEKLTRRLQELGFYVGVEVKVLSRAPLWGPYVVQLQDSVVALRREEAQCLLIK